MSLSKKQAEKPVIIYEYRKCPHCTNKQHSENYYCAYCGKVITHDQNGYTPVIKDKINHKIIKPNVNAKEHSCERCGQNCDFCYSFGVGKINKDGFGGEECEHRKDLIRCRCCLEYVLEFKKNKFNTSPLTIKKIIEKMLSQWNRAA